MTVANVNVTKVLFKRGNTVQNNSYTGVSGEITIDTQAKTLRIHDGSTVGGNIITATLTGNAGSQQAAIDSLSANIGSYQIYANSNASTQTVSINSINANLGAFQSYANITLSTIANAASQESAINSLRANITAANSAITSLTSNAAIQAALLDTLTGNAATQSTVLDTLTSNAATQATTLTTLLANAISQESSLISLLGNAATQGSLINSKANLSGALFTGNIEVPYLIANNQVHINEHLLVGVQHDQGIPFLNPAGLFFGNTYSSASDKYYQLILQNSDPNGSGDIVVTADDGNDSSNYITMGINGSTYSDPSFISGPGNNPHDGYLYMTGGNLVVAGGSDLFVASGTTANLHLIGGGSSNTTIVSDNTNGSWNIGGNLIPNANITYSLGDATHQWKDLWVSNNTIYIGNTPVRVHNGTLLVNDTAIADTVSKLTNGAYTFNLFANGQSRSPDTIFASNGVSIINANGSIQGGMYNSGDADWLNIGASTGRGIKFYVNEEDAGPQFFSNGSVNVPSNLYSVAGVIGDVSMYGGTIAGTNPNWNNLTIANQVEGYVFVQLPNDATANVANLRIHNDIGNIEIGTGDGVTNYNSYFTKYGELKLSNGLVFDINGSINATGGTAIFQSTDYDLRLRANTNGTMKEWGFTEDGTLTFPEGHRIFADSQTLLISSDDEDSIVLKTHTGGYSGGGTDYFWTFDNDGKLTLAGNVASLQYTGGNFFIDVNSNQNIVIGNSGGMSYWAFNANTQTITFPDATIQPTAFFGYSVPTTFNNNVSVTGNIITTNGIYWSNGAAYSTGGGISFGNTIAIGYNTGTVSQGSKAVAVGSTAGNVSQGTGAVAVGDRSGVTSQGNLTVAVGSQAGEISQGLQATAVGSGAGNYNQGAGTVAIGTNAGALNQGLRATAVGSMAGGLNQGEYAVAIGNFAGGSNQANNSIIINATGSSLDQTTANTFTVKPIRNAAGSTVLYYDVSTGEITYDTAGAGSYGNVEVAQYLSNYDGTINFTGSPAIITGLGNITTASAYVSSDLIAGNIKTTNGVFWSNGTNLLSSLASQSYVDTQITNLVNNAPALLDTLGEIAANLATEANAVGSVLNSLTNTNANVTAANLNITALQSNAGSQQTSIDTLLNRVNQEVNNTSSPQFAGLTTTANVELTGNVHIHQNLVVDGNINFIGNVTQTNITTANAVFTGDTYGFGALYAGVLGYTPLPYTVIQATADYNDYSQINFQNLNLSANASTEWVATAGNGTDLTNYIDFGIAGGAWNGTQLNSVGTAAKANDGWVYVLGNTAAGTGGNLVLGTIQPGKRVNILTGGPGSANIYSYFNNSGLTTANIYATNYLYANGTSILTGIGGTYSNTNVAGYLAGNVTTGNIQVGTTMQLRGTDNSIATTNGSAINIYSRVNISGSAVNVGLNVSGNLVVNQNSNATSFYGTNYYYSNGVSILSGIGGTYSNVNVEAYIGGNIGSYQIYANANVAAQATSINSINANVGAYQIYANANAITQATSIDVINANLSAYQTFANANVSSIQNQIFASNANIGAFQTYANATFGVSSYGNTQVAAYLLTYPNANVATQNTTSANITTLRAANFSSANAVISGGYISALTNASVITATITTVNSTAGNITTLAAANFSTANAVVTGGYATGLANISVTGNATVGNLVGTSPNTTIISGAYTSTFDNVGNVILPNLYVSGNTTAMGIAAGYAPNRPAFRIYGGTPAWWTTANTNFKGSSIVVDYNQGGYFNSSTGVFTAPVAGLYQTTLNARIGSVNAQGQILVIKNGLNTAGNAMMMWEADTNTGTAVHFGVSTVIKLAAGDILTANITAGNIQFDQNDSWTVTYIG